MMRGEQGFGFEEEEIRHQRRRKQRRGLRQDSADQRTCLLQDRSPGEQTDEHLQTEEHGRDGAQSTLRIRQHGRAQRSLASHQMPEPEHTRAEQLNRHARMIDERCRFALGQAEGAEQVEIRWVVVLTEPELAPTLPEPHSQGDQQGRNRRDGGQPAPGERTAQRLDLHAARPKATAAPLRAGPTAPRARPAGARAGRAARRSAAPGR